MDAGRLTRTTATWAGRAGTWTCFIEDSAKAVQAASVLGRSIDKCRNQLVTCGQCSLQLSRIGKTDVSAQQIQAWPKAQQPGGVIKCYVRFKNPAHSDSHLACLVASRRVDRRETQPQCWARQALVRLLGSSLLRSGGTGKAPRSAHMCKLHVLVGLSTIGIKAAACRTSMCLQALQTTDLSGSCCTRRTNEPSFRVTNQSSNSVSELLPSSSSTSCKGEASQAFEQTQNSEQRADYCMRWTLWPVLEVGEQKHGHHAAKALRFRHTFRKPL